MQNRARAKMREGDRVRVRGAGLDGTIGGAFEADGGVTYFVVYDGDAAQPGDSTGESFAEHELEPL